MIQPKPVINIDDVSISLLVQVDFWNRGSQMTLRVLLSDVPLLPDWRLSRLQWPIDGPQCQPLTERDNTILSTFKTRYRPPFSLDNSENLRANCGTKCLPRERLAVHLLRHSGSCQEEKR